MKPCALILRIVALAVALVAFALGLALTIAFPAPAFAQRKHVLPDFTSAHPPSSTAKANAIAGEVSDESLSPTAI